MICSIGKVGGVILLANCAFFAQTGEGPRSFSGTNNTQIVSVQQNGTGNGVRAIVKGQSAQAVRGVATSTHGQNFGVEGVSMSQSGTGVFGRASSATGITYGVRGISDSVQGIGVEGDSISSTQSGIGVVGQFFGDRGIGVLGMNGTGAPINPIGVMGVIGTNVVGGAAGVFENDNDCPAGTTCPGLGDILWGRTNSTIVFRVDTQGKVYADGGFAAHGADFAESVRVQGAQQRYSPGDLLQIDEENDMQLTLASHPYSKAVVGIYSTQPGILASPYKMADTPAAGEVPLAVVGIVPCKVNTENGPIRRGDLLVASSTPGYAMRGTDPARLTGAVVGKAMQSFESGKGTIQVLVSLQ